MNTDFSNNDPGYASDDSLSPLRDAMSQKSYPSIYKELRRCSGPFSPGDAYDLLGDALENGLTLRVFEAVLDKSPPLPEILSYDNTKNLLNLILDPPGLICKAAYQDRGDVLSMFIERGASPNGTDGKCSPLESALMGQALSSVEVLIQQPELDISWTPQLLFEWARTGADPDLRDFCIQTIAPRFTGWDPLSFQPLPIPEPMTAQIIAKARSWPLLERFCRERAPVSPEDVRAAIRIISLQALGPNLGDEPVSLMPEDTQAVCAEALAALLESCPALPRRETDCRALLRCFLNLGETARERLRPWTDKLGRRRIAMDWVDWNRGEYANFPDLWQSLLPNGPTLVIDRWSGIFDPFLAVPQHAKALSHILDSCPIRGKGRSGKLSPVARAVLYHGDAALIESLFQRSDGLLATEDPDALMDYVLQGSCPRAIRAAVLAHVRKTVDYEL